MKISFEMACELGLIRDDALEFAQRRVEGASILSPATDRAVEDAFRFRRKEIYNRFNIQDGMVEVDSKLSRLSIASHR
jgi:hypothetical protein